MDATSKISVEALVYDTFRFADWPFYQALKRDCNNKGVDINNLLKWAFGTNYKSLHVNCLFVEWEVLHPALPEFPFSDQKRVSFLIEQYKVWLGE